MFDSFAHEFIKVRLNHRPNERMNAFVRIQQPSLLERYDHRNSYIIIETNG